MDSPPSPEEVKPKIGRIQIVLFRDVALIVFSIIVAVILARTTAIHQILAAGNANAFLGSFIAGIFFVSVFTATPAIVVLGEIAQSGSVFWTAVFGGLGALVGDYLIFRFVKDNLGETLANLLNKTGLERIKSILHMRFFRWLIPFIGALIIATPLPDELGLMVLGLYKIETRMFILLSFLLNSLGILVIGLIARSLV